MLDFIAKPLGQFLFFIYNTLAFHNYGFAILIFTLIIKVLLLPLTVKQYHSMARMQQLQPQMQEIQKRYKNDKERLNQELMKFYQENKYNPAAGCLPTLLQLPILFSLFYIIRSPLVYMLGKSKETVAKLLEIVPAVERIANNPDISIINYFTAHSDKLSQVGDLLRVNELIDLNFFGLNLGMIPTYHFDKFADPVLGGQYIALLIIPILVVASQYLSMKTSMAQAASNATNPMQSSFLYIAPIMSLIISFSVPAGVGLYWIALSLVQVVQQLYMNKFVIKKKEVVNK